MTTFEKISRIRQLRKRLKRTSREEGELDGLIALILAELEYRATDKKGTYYD